MEHVCECDVSPRASKWEKWLSSENLRSIIRPEVKLENSPKDSPICQAPGRWDYHFEEQDWQLEYRLNCSRHAGWPHQDPIQVLSHSRPDWQLSDLLAFHDMGLQRKGLLVSNTVLVLANLRNIKYFFNWRIKCSDYAWVLGTEYGVFLFLFFS